MSNLFFLFESRIFADDTDDADFKGFSVSSGCYL